MKLQPLKQNRYRRIIGAAAIAGALALSMAVPAFADDTTVPVTAQVISGSELTAGVSSSPNFDPFTYQLSGPGTTNPSLLPVPFSVTDGRGLPDGWTVTMESSDFVGQASLYTFPATGFVVSGIDDFTSLLDSTTNVTVTDTVTDGLNTPQTIAQAADGFGAGVFNSHVSFGLTVPGGAPIDIYHATLTTTIVTAP